jgi:hypothetical protein
MTGASRRDVGYWGKSGQHYARRELFRDVISGQASSGAIRVTSVRARREDRSSISSHPLATLGRLTAVGLGHRTTPHFRVCLCSCLAAVPSSRPAQADAPLRPIRRRSISTSIATRRRCSASRSAIFSTPCNRRWAPSTSTTSTSSAAPVPHKR